MSWLQIYRAECSDRMRKQYEGMIEYAAQALRKEKIRTILPGDVQRVCNTMSVYSQSYISKFMSMLSGIFKTAAANGFVLRNPMDAVKKPKGKPCQGHRALEGWERKLVMDTFAGHDFGRTAMVMLLAGLRRGEALYVDVDRDVDFTRGTLTVRGAVSFVNGNEVAVTEGKTEAARRTIPMTEKLTAALRGQHGLLCPNQDGGLMTPTAFKRKYESYLCYLERQLNGCPKRWWGKTNEHRQLLAQGGVLPEWRSVNIRCHDFRTDFCTRNYYAGTPIKTLEKWMGHADSSMILSVYTKLSEEQEARDAKAMKDYLDQ